jgi:hypothetical protein
LDLKMIEDLFQVEERANAPDLGSLFYSIWQRFIPYSSTESCLSLSAHITKKSGPKSLLDNKRAQNLGELL